MAQILLSTAIEAYLKTRERGSRATYTQDRDVCRRFLRVSGDLQLRHLTPLHLERYFYGGTIQRRQWPGIAATVGDHAFNGYRGRLAALFGYCRASGWIQLDPLVNVRRARSVPRDKVWLAPGQLMALLDAARSPRDRAFMATAMNTGLRASEVASLRVGSVNLAAGTLSVEVTKTSQRDVMPVTADLDQELRAWLTAYAEEVPIAASMYLFPRRESPRFAWHTAADGSRHSTLARGSLVPHERVAHPALIVRRAGESLGWDMRGQGVHLLRRSTARAYFEMRRAEGYDGALRETSALLHHSRSSTTEGYLGLDPERERRDQALRGQPFLTRLAADNVVPLRRAEGI